MTSDALQGLSRRQREVLTSLLESKPHKVIAYELGISDKTVYEHKASAFRKLGLKTTVDLLSFGIRQGLIEA